MDVNEIPLSSADKAAVLLMTVGEEKAAEILKFMGPKEVQRVGSAMSALDKVSRSEVAGVLEDFLGRFEAQTGLGTANEEYIRKMLVQALGADKASGILDSILANSSKDGLESLRWMDPRSISEAIKDEHPQIQAVVLSHLEPDRAAIILEDFPEKNRLDVVVRIANLESVSPEALEELNQLLAKRFAGGNLNQVTNIGGRKSAAEILNNFNKETESTVMESIVELDEMLGAEIQELMFVFDNLKDLDDRAVQRLLRDISSDLLILALKGADSELQEHIYGNMSKRAADLLRDDLEAKGPVRVTDVENAQKEILAVARKLADDGEIQLGSGGEDML